MSKTAALDWWASNAEYHSMRSPYAHGQVKAQIIPKLLEAVGGRSHISVCDFACGAGTIAKEVISQSSEHKKTITDMVLIDVMRDNLTAAEKLLTESNVKSILHKVLVNGSEFVEFTGPKVDFLYCWDAMVHFDIVDIIGYLRTLDRVCSGFAMFHHSNFYHRTTDIRSNPHWRNFMSKDVFWQMCVSCGHEVISQEGIDWDIPELDCITLVKVGAKKAT